MVDLYCTFVKIGAVMFGGGYSMLPILIRELVDKKKWCTEEEVLDYFSLAQCTPGVIAINSATFVGYKHSGVPGGIIASLGVVTVPVIVITIIASILQNLLQYPVVQHIFAGVRIGVAALMTVTIYRLIKKAAKSWITGAIVVFSFLILTVIRIDSVWLVIMAATFGILFGRVKKHD